MVWLASNIFSSVLALARQFPNLPTRKLKAKEDDMDGDLLSRVIIVHEKQHLQLCAVHAVNNLLQLSKDEHDSKYQWLCGERELKLCAAQLLPATKAEFDEIADGLTVLENDLLSLVHTVSNEIGRRRGPNLYERINSNHRTIFFGNYSFEVLQTALHNRGVALLWWQVREQPSFVSDGKGDKSEIENNVMGFIINVSNEDRSIFRFLPFFGQLFKEGRHWYAISRVHRFLRCNGISPMSSQWNLIDSDISEVGAILSDCELLDHLRQASETGGAIFKATYTNLI